MIEDHIIRGQGPTAMKSKLGYLLSGPLSQSPHPTTSALNIITQQIEEDCDLQKFWAIESTGTSSPNTVWRKNLTGKIFDEWAYGKF